jgi:transporter family-2 protein
VTEHNHRLGYVIAVTMSIVAGMGVALQSRLNGELGLELGNGSLAALISFSSGLLLLALALCFSARARRGLRDVLNKVRHGDLPWWSIIGGLGGGMLVLTQGLVAGFLGVALFSVAVVAGQTFGALAIDTRGLIGFARIPLGAPRIVGALMVVAGIATTASIGESAGGLSWQFLLPLVAGVGTGFQQALNGTVQRASQSALAATFINFTMGTLILLVITLASAPCVSAPTELPSQWWLYLGGFVGTLFISIQTVTVNRIGVLGLGVSLVTGQVLGSILLDLFLPMGFHPVTAWTIVGAVLTVAGSALVTLTRLGASRPSG